MARKVTGKRSVGRNGSVRVHGKASNGEGSVYLDAGPNPATYGAQHGGLGLPLAGGLIGWWLDVQSVRQAVGQTLGVTHATGACCVDILRSR